MFPPCPFALAVLQTDVVSADAPIGTRMIAAAIANASIVLDRVLRRFIPIVTIDLLRVVRCDGSRAISRLRDLWLCVPASRRVCPCAFVRTAHRAGPRPC